MARKAFDKGKTPKKTVTAIFPTDYRVGDIKLYPVNTLSAVALDKLESPVFSGRFKMGFKDVTNALYVLSRTPDELESLMTRPDQEFRQAFAHWAKGVPPGLALASASVIIQMIVEAFSTYVSGERNPS